MIGPGARWLVHSSEMMRQIKAAAVQFNHAPGNKAFNFRRIQSFVKDAAAQEVDLIVFPEMCITGYWHVRKLSRAEIESLAELVPTTLSDHMIQNCLSGTA